jgi:hypothetical protein
MTRTNSTTLHLVAMLAACSLAGCVDDDPTETATDELGQPQPSDPVLKYLASLPAAAGGESALAHLFAEGTADHVPVGDGVGYPVLFNSVPELNWLASQLWGGKTFRVVEPGTHPNGDPIVALDNKIIQTPAGAVLNLFDAYVTRSTIADLAIGTNSRGEAVPSPRGALAPVAISFLDEPAVIDDRPSVILNYFEDDSLPIIRRILDEVREIDPASCPGVYLGRAHVRRCTSFACGEAWTPLVDAPAHATFDTRYAWSFWTYFLLDFDGDGAASCDLAPAIARAEAALEIDLPPTP